MSQTRRKKTLKSFLATILLIGLVAYYKGDLSQLKLDLDTHTPAQTQSITKTEAATPNISERAEQHILYGDHRGGGHKYGVGKPCKSEFPQNWDDQKIISTVKRLAANDNARWEQQNNGYYVSETMENGVKVRIVMGNKRQNVITAYPVNTRRNPCPANDR